MPETERQPATFPIETLFHTSDGYFDDVLHGIHQAQSQIDMEVYIYETAGIGSRITRALTQAAQRGVKVRLMVDGAGAPFNFHNTAQLLRKSGVEVRIYHPLPWRLQHWPYAFITEPRLQKLWRLLTALNQRNHRKMLIIDEQIIWLGSINISQSHLQQQAGGKGWRDTAIRIEKTDLSLAIEAFNLIWYRAKRRIRKELGKQHQESLFLLNFTKQLRTQSHRKVLKRIDLASQRIWVTNAYFAPTRQLILSLEQASQRGVDVRILLPAKSDIGFMPWVSSFFYGRLLKNGVKIYEYRPAMLHSKSLIIDDWACLGSSNLNQRSLIHDLEIDYQVQGEKTRQELAQHFAEDLKHASPLHAKSSRSFALWRRLLGALLLLSIGRWL